MQRNGVTNFPGVFGEEGNERLELILFGEGESFWPDQTDINNRFHYGRSHREDFTLVLLSVSSKDRRWDTFSILFLLFSSSAKHLFNLTLTPEGSYTLSSTQKWTTEG